MKPWLRLAIVLAVALVVWRCWPAQPAPDRYPPYLPREAVATLSQNEQGGPFAYDRDGSVFQNRERHLPERPEGYYR